MKRNAQSGPLVSVAMATHRGGPDLDRALDSIRRQSYENLEIIVVDDASEDDAFAQLERAACIDTRIRIIRNDCRKGLAASMNRALEHARGKYIARMDSDDESHLKRIERQVRYLEAHPEISICGTGARKWMNGRFYSMHLPRTQKEIRVALLFHTAFAHPTVMWRKVDFDKLGLRYDETFPTAQDYELWTRVIGPLKGVNLRAKLLDYYCHSGQVTTTFYHETVECRRRIAERVLRPLLPDLTLKQIDIHLRVAIPYDPFSPVELDQAESWLIALLEANCKHRIYDESALRWMLAEKWRLVCDISSGRDNSLLFRYLKSPLVKGLRYLPQITKFTMKRLMGK